MSGDEDDPSGSPAGEGAVRPESDVVDTAAPPDDRADAVIKRHVVYSMLSGGIPVPVVDLAASTAVQLDMLKQLAAVYEAAFDARSSRAFVASAMAALAGNATGRLGASLLKAVPG